MKLYKYLKILPLFLFLLFFSFDLRAEDTLSVVRMRKHLDLMGNKLAEKISLNNKKTVKEQKAEDYILSFTPVNDAGVVYEWVNGGVSFFTSSVLNDIKASISGFNISKNDDVEKPKLYLLAGRFVPNYKFTNAFATEADYKKLFNTDLSAALTAPGNTFSGRNDMPYAQKRDEQVNMAIADGGTQSAKRIIVLSVFEVWEVSRELIRDDASTAILPYKWQGKYKKAIYTNIVSYEYSNGVYVKNTNTAVLKVLKDINKYRHTSIELWAPNAASGQSYDPYLSGALSKDIIKKIGNDYGDILLAPLAEFTETHANSLSALNPFTNFYTTTPAVTPPLAIGTTPTLPAGATKTTVTVNNPTTNKKTTTTTLTLDATITTKEGKTSAFLAAVSEILAESDAFIKSKKGNGGTQLVGIRFVNYSTSSDVEDYPYKAIITITLDGKVTEEIIELANTVAKPGATSRAYKGTPSKIRGIVNGLYNKLQIIENSGTANTTTTSTANAKIVTIQAKLLQISTVWGGGTIGQTQVAGLARCGILGLGECVGSIYTKITGSVNLVEDYKKTGLDIDKFCIMIEFLPISNGLSGSIRQKKFTLDDPMLIANLDKIIENKVKGLECKLEEDQGDIWIYRAMKKNTNGSWIDSPLIGSPNANQKGARTPESVVNNSNGTFDIQPIGINKMVGLGFTVIPPQPQGTSLDGLSASLVKRARPDQFDAKVKRKNLPIGLLAENDHDEHICIYPASAMTFIQYQTLLNSIPWE
jgi:hypothetical protein